MTSRLAVRRGSLGVGLLVSRMRGNLWILRHSGGWTKLDSPMAAVVTVGVLGPWPRELGARPRSMEVGVGPSYLRRVSSLALQKLSSDGAIWLREDGSWIRWPLAMFDGGERKSMACKGYEDFLVIFFLSGPFMQLRKDNCILL